MGILPLCLFCHLVYLNFLCCTFPNSEGKCFICLRGMGGGWTGNVRNAPCTCRVWRVKGGGWGKEHNGLMRSIPYHLMYVFSITAESISQVNHGQNTLHISRNITDFMSSLINTNAILWGNKMTLPHYISSLPFTRIAMTSFPTLITPHLEYCNNFPTDLLPSWGSPCRFCP